MPGPKGVINLQIFRHLVYNVKWSQFQQKPDSDLWSLFSPARSIGFGSDWHVLYKGMVSVWLVPALTNPEVSVQIAAEWINKYTSSLQYLNYKNIWFAHKHSQCNHNNHSFQTTSLSKFRSFKGRIRKCAEDLTHMRCIKIWPIWQLQQKRSTATYAGGCTLKSEFFIMLPYAHHIKHANSENV